jgi:putative acyl-CoA dehydrogenase
VESEAATLTALRLARAFDEDDGPFRRLATAVAKFWVCKRTPPLVAEALECLGGNGFVEESQLPRLFRESPLNSIWEGSGNVNALDVLRALEREPETAEAFLAEVRLAAGDDPRLDAAVERLERELTAPDEQGARRLLELLAVTLQGSLMLRHGSPDVADAFCASRLERPGGVYGTLPAGIDLARIVERHRPQLGG